MGGLDPAKLLVILALALVLLGPERLPRAARQVGTAWRELTKVRDRLEEEIRSAVPDLDLPEIPRVPRGGLTGYLTGMMSESGSPRPTGAEGESVAGESEAPVSDRRPGQPLSRDGRRARETAWQSSGTMVATANPSPVVAPAGVPAGWNSSGAEAPGYASGSKLSPLPSGGPEALLGAEVRLDLDDPSWN